MVRTALLALTLVVVGAASALNLVLGGLWVAAFLGIAVLRRRVRAAAVLVLLGAIGLGALARWGGVAAPRAASYEVDEVAWIRSWLPGVGHPGLGEDGAESEPATGLRQRLEARRREELGYAIPEIERRAAAAIVASRHIGGLRERAPTEVVQVEEAVRRLALTLTAPEFADLAGRRAGLRRWLDDLAGRLRMARDDPDREAVRRALDPAVMAPLSFRPLAEDLRRAEGAMRALVRAVTGRDVTVTATSRVGYDERRGELRHEEVYRLAVPPPLGVRRLDVAGFRRRGAAQGDAEGLRYRLGAGEPRALAGTEVLELESAAGEVTLIATRVRPAAPVPVRPMLRPVPFRRLVIEEASAPPALGVTLALGDPAGSELLVTLEPAPAAVERVTLPRLSFHFASASGTLTRHDEEDRWTADGGAGVHGPVAVELVPPTPILRNPGFSAARVYLYTPNLAAALGGIALAALAHVLARRPRGPIAPAPAAAR